MSALAMQGKGDAYLEWAIASGFRWSDPHANTSITYVLLQTAKTPSVTATAATNAQLTDPVWLATVAHAELATAIGALEPAISTKTKEGLPPAETVLGLIDSGIGQHWLANNPSYTRRSHALWDMAPAAPAPLPRASHGAHVLSWLAGHVPYPGLDAPTDLASHCPLLLANLPPDAVNDTSGRWLGQHVVQGLDWMIKQARQWQAPRLVVNLSWGPQTGPHDGSSLLERALAQRTMANDMEVHLVVAAGNSRLARAHARMACKAGGELSWVVPPASRQPFFLELWWPAHVTAAQARITVTSPAGQTLQCTGEGVCAHAGAWLIRVPHPHGQGATHATRPMALLALNPTAGGQDVAAHGRWHIQIAPVSGMQGEVHAYVARHTANMGGRYSGPDSHLDGPGVSSQGTLSGLSTSGSPRVYAAAGQVHGRAQASAYSSEGPGQQGAPPRPDWAMPCDESPLLHGVLGAGSRPGSVVRLVGTSMAAPQLARQIANNTPLPARTTHDTRLGYGCPPPLWSSRQRS